MSDIKVLDVTLRDGGCVNDFNFGQTSMERILDSIEKAGIDYIELGYIDQKEGSPVGRTKFCDEKVIYSNFLKEKKKESTYLAMIDYGKFDVDLLEERNPKGIDGIRLAFHKKDAVKALKVGNEILKKGYKLFMQPMLTIHYTDAELLELIEGINRELSGTEALYIVDSFGEMRPEDVTRIAGLVDHNLNADIRLGLHTHNNLQLAYSNVIAVLSMNIQRSIVIDSSILGMGKGAGNLNTELLLEDLNRQYGNAYHTTALMDVMDQVMKVLEKEFSWGYSIEYYLSSINQCSPSYAKYFYGKHMLPISDVAELLKAIEPQKRDSFDKQYAEKVYTKYNQRKQADDGKIIQQLKQSFAEKEVLLIAPGKSIIRAKEEIWSKLQEKEIVSVSLNNEEYDTDYIFVTRKDFYSRLKNRKNNVIAPSNMDDDPPESVKIVDYLHWIINFPDIQDSAGAIVLNILNQLGVKKVYLAGFDGFSGDVNENYYDGNMRISISSKEAEMKNRMFGMYLTQLYNDKNIVFLTPSEYEKYLSERDEGKV